MAEAVFTISAEITPQLDDRAIQRQAQQLAAQLNSILAKNIQPISVNPATGQFRPFQQEVDKARGVLDRFQDSVGGIPRSLSNIARAGRSNFLKFTDAVNLTRREVVGFGRGIRDSIRVTNLFENALEGIKDTGATLSELPQNFQDLAAQVRTGVSAIDQMAAAGNPLAQLFQPLQQQGEAARTEFVELNRSVDQLVAAVNTLGNATARTGSTVRDQFGVPIFDQQIKSFEELLPLVASSPTLFNKLKNSIDVAEESGNLAGIHRELTEIITEAEKVTGPLGRIRQEINEATGGRLFAGTTEEVRALNEELRKGAIDKLRELGGNELLGPFQNLASGLRTVRENVEKVINVFNALRTGLASILPGVSPIGQLVDSAADAVTFFKVLRAEGVPALQAIRQASLEAFDQFKKSNGITAGINRIRQEIVGLGLLFGQTKFGEQFFKATADVGNFLNKNLIDPLRKGKGQIKQAFSEIGRDFSNGLGSGIESGGTQVQQKSKSVAVKALRAMADELQTRSDSKKTYKYGQDVASGLAHGAESGQGLVNKAFASLGQGLTALGQQLTQFISSVGIVSGTVLAGLGAKALIAGKEFNVLKQVVNATIPVLVGSKEAAAGLLAEVNELNNSSPFARSTFLELTRVLAGFGVEAKKITPLIDAIQQTVAATGGSDQDILELGQAFAKLQSQGRVTGEILQSFSIRGVDAVAVLAKGFDKTTSEMRKMISDGLVPATKAIDILTVGLKEKFDGATDAVAKNFPGALQRVQARLRDIGGTLLTAFITPEGGGALVDFLNNMADSLSHINKVVLPELAPLLKKAADALVILSEKIEKVVKSFDRFDAQEFIEKLKGWAPILAALAGLIPSAFGFIPVVGPIIAGLGGPITAIAAAMAVLVVQSGHLNEVTKGVTEGFSGLQEGLAPAVSFIQDNAVGTLALLATTVDKTGKTVAVGVNAVQKGITGLGAGVAGATKVVPVVGKVGGAFSGITNLISKFLGFFGKVGPTFAKLLPQSGKLAAGLKILTGPIGLVASIIAQLIITSARFRDALKRLWEAVKPVAQVIGSVLAVAIKVLDEAIKALEPVFTAAINILAGFFEWISPVVEKVQAFLKVMQEQKVIEKFFGALKKSLETIIGVINVAIDAVDKLLGPFINIGELKVNITADVDPLKKAADEAKKKLEEQKKAAEASSAAIEDAYNAASKAVETADKAMGDANDQLVQAVNQAAGVIQGIISASRAVQTANAAISDAKQKEIEATTDLSNLEKERARAIEDTISPINELAVAERNLTRVRKGLTDLAREEIRLGDETKKLRQELSALQGEGAAIDRAALARGEERAQIALNRAKQAEIDLLNELNPKEKVSINLAGLSLDQIRAKLAAARASATVTKKERERTPQEIADLKTSARLDVEDAAAGVDAAKKARADFEIETREKIQEIGEKIRDNDERLKEIADDRADQLLDEEEALKGINRLRAGENSLAQVTLDYDTKIKEAKNTQKEASEAIKTATQAAQIAQAEYAVKVAEAKGNANDLYTAQNNLNNLLMQGSGLNSNSRELRDIMQKQKENVQAARDAANEMVTNLKNANAELAKITAVQGVGGALTGFESTEAAFNRATETGKEGVADRIFPKLDPAKNAAIGALRAALASGAALQKNKNFEPWTPTPGQIEAVIRKVLELALTNSLRDAMAKGLNAFNLSLTGIAAAKGLSPGMIHPGMHDGRGLVRMFEFGKEAVLPLTRPSDMKRIVNDPSVLPAILNALDLPGFASGTTGTSQDAKMKALQDKLLSARKAALAVAQQSEEAQVSEAQAARDALMAARERVAAQQELNVQLSISEELLQRMRVSGAEVAGNTNIINNALTEPESKLRQILQDVFNKIGLQFPGFSTGYAPGDLVHSGMNNGVGIARMFEYGREAVLPLTRPFDLARVVRNPAVLPAVLNALPRWSRPEVSLDSGTSSDLATVVRSGRLNGGPANREVYEKKAQREFASTIGDAVKIAVKEAILESDGLQGDDVDINIGMGASDTQRMIAREVKRQLDKRTGKW